MEKPGTREIPALGCTSPLTIANRGLAEVSDDEKSSGLSAVVDLKQENKALRCRADIAVKPSGGTAFNLKA
jgi:hypothetical protein